MENMGSHRLTPQAQPVKKIHMFKCGECKFEFNSEDILSNKAYKAQHHRIPAQQQAVNTSPSCQSFGHMKHQCPLLKTSAAPSGPK